MLEIYIYSKILEFLDIAVTCILLYVKNTPKSWKYGNVYGLVVGCDGAGEANGRDREAFVDHYNPPVQTMLPGAFGDPQS
jgi:hypothetical protein